MSKTTFKITPNTDTVDIDQKCIGLDVQSKTWSRDVRDHLKTNRGLHIQIKHNQNPQTFAQANEVSNLIAAAPELLKSLEAFMERYKGIKATSPFDGSLEMWEEAKQIIKKARGENE